AMSSGAAAGAAVFRPPVLAIDDLGQAVGARDGANDQVAAVAAIAAVGPAARHVFFPAETAAAAASVATLHEDNYSVHEHLRPLSRARPVPALYSDEARIE